METGDRATDLYKLEYEKAAERYDNIYRSMWTIFSYLAAVTAGILTFGSEKIEWHALICIAAIPLIFWFWTTYLPLDRYGTETLRRLGNIEELLNGKFGTELNHFKSSRCKHLSLIAGFWRAFCDPDPCSPPRVEAPSSPALCLSLSRWWSKQLEKHNRLFPAIRAVWHQVRRARFAIWILFILLHVVVLGNWMAFRRSGKPLFQQRPAATAGGNITVVGH